MEFRATFNTWEEVVDFAKGILKNERISETDGRDQPSVDLVKTDCPEEPKQAYSAQIAKNLQLTPEQMSGGQAPVASAPITPTAPVSAVPTSERTYKLDELASAAMTLMDKGMQGQLQELLSGYGVEALPMLPQEQYGNFATALRGMGAQI